MEREAGSLNSSSSCALNLLCGPGQVPFPLCAFMLEKLSLVWSAELSCFVGPWNLGFLFVKLVLLPTVSISWSLCGLCRKVCEFHLLREFQTASLTCLPWVKAFLGSHRPVPSLTGRDKGEPGPVSGLRTLCVQYRGCAQRSAGLLPPPGALRLLGQSCSLLVQHFPSWVCILWDVSRIQ